MGPDLGSTYVTSQPFHQDFYLIIWNQDLTPISRGTLIANWDVKFIQMLKEVQLVFEHSQQVLCLGGGAGGDASFQ